MEVGRLDVEAELGGRDHLKPNGRKEGRQRHRKKKGVKTDWTDERCRAKSEKQSFSAI